MKQISRQEMITRLVDRDIDNFFERADMADYLSYLFRTGVVGYDSYTDKELEDECFDYGLMEDDK